MVIPTIIPTVIDRSKPTPYKPGISYSSVEDRIAIADHPTTSYKTLQCLSGDESVDLRYALAENHNIDSRILDTLSEDTNPFIAHRAKKTLERLSSAVKVVITSVLKPVLKPLKNKH